MNIIKCLRYIQWNPAYSRLRLRSKSACGGGLPVIRGEHEKQLHVPPRNGSVDLVQASSFIP